MSARAPNSFHPEPAYDLYPKRAERNRSAGDKAVIPFSKVASISIQIILYIAPSLSFLAFDALVPSSR